GEPFLVSSSGSRPTVAADGTLSIVTDQGDANNAQLTWVDRKGAVVNAVGRIGKTVAAPRLSPDGRRVVGFVGGDRPDRTDLWVIDLERHAERRLSYEPGLNMFPQWSRDGKYVVYQCQGGVCSRPADGTGQPLVLVPKPATRPSLSPDGRSLIFAREQM